MKAAKIRKTNKKEEEKVVEQEFTFKRLFGIIIVIVLVLVIFYFITTIFAKEPEQEDAPTSVSQIDSSKITIGELLTRSESNYYVLATKKSDTAKDYSELYSKYIEDYSEAEDSLKFYYVDLDSALNKKNVSDELNITDDVSALTVNDDILFVIKDNKIDSYFAGSTKIVEALSNL